MSRPEKPSDFDWVSVRAKCSPLNMFGLLKLEAGKNIETMRKLTKAQGNEIPLELFDNATSFGVIRRAYAGELGVRFTIRNEEIRVESQHPKVSFTATLTVGDDGECRFLVDGKELDLWQVLRRALEPLFFGSVD